MRRTLRGALRNPSPVKRKIYRAAPKAALRRKAAKSLGHPTTLRGWKGASSRMIRYGQGCLIQVLVFVLLVIILLIFA